MTKHFPTVNVGVDVGKSQLDLYLLERGRAMTIPNEEPDISNLIRALRRFRIERIVVEATGRLEQPFVRAALAARLPVIVVSPLKIRRFAEVIGQLAKTDAIDARLIAQFAATVKPAARPPPKQMLAPSKTWSFAVVSSPRCAPWRRTAGRSYHQNSNRASIG